MLSVLSVVIISIAIVPFGRKGASMESQMPLDLMAVGQTSGQGSLNTTYVFITIKNYVTNAAGF
jgi:hypothetical protein